MIDVADFLQRMATARSYTKSLFADVDADDFCRQVHPEFSPLGWHLGHIGVTEAFWILQRCHAEPSLAPTYDKVFSSLENPKPNRTRLPSPHEVMAYLDTVRDRAFHFLERGCWKDGHALLDEGRILNMLLQHEEQHNELILLIWNLLAAARHDAGRRGDTVQSVHPPRIEPARTRGSAPTTSGSGDMLYVSAGSFLMGSDCIATTLDNERPQHVARTRDFLIDPAPVSNTDFLDFMQHGGYDEPTHWSSAGWRWRTDHQVEHPLYWRRLGTCGWVEIGPLGSAPLDPRQPVMCVSWYEADAYARAAGKRLPTETEWEKAVGGEPAQAHAGRTVDGSVGSVPLFGRVWEWTDTWFAPYPGFRAFPYEGYSVPYFDEQHRVLRGGSWATRPHVLRSTFRNWYHPGTQAAFAGFRCAKDVTPRADVQ